MQRRKGTANVLLDTGVLRNSINRRAFPDRVEIGTNVKYARIHQLGGTVNHPARSWTQWTKAYKSGKRKG